MTSKRTVNKRKLTSKNVSRNKRCRTAQPTYANASELERGHGLASDIFWAATRILQDNGTHYLVEWEDIDLSTGIPYKPTWEPHNFVTSALKSEWMEAMASRSVAESHSQSQDLSYEEAGDREGSLDKLPESVTVTHVTTPAQALTERGLQSPSALVASPQQPQQSQRDPDSLSVRLQRSECEVETGDLRSYSVVLASQSTNDSASYTATTLKEASGSNQRDSLTVVHDPGNTDEEDRSLTDSNVLALLNSSHALPPAPIERADSVEIIQQSPQPGLIEEVQEEEEEEEEVESPAQEELESLEKARQESLGTQTRIVDENKLTSSAPLASEEYSKVEEQQNMHDETEVRKPSLSGLTAEAVYGLSEFSAKAEPVFRTETRRKVDLEEAATVLPSAETREEQSQVTTSQEQSPKGLSQRHQPHAEFVMRRVPASSDVSEVFDESTSIPAHSEQPMALLPGQSELAEQPTIDHTHDSLVSSSYNTRIEQLATSSESSPRLEQRQSPRLEQRHTIEQKRSLSWRTGISSAPKQSMNSCRTTNHSVSVAITNRDRSPGSPSKSTRSTLNGARQSRNKLFAAPQSLSRSHASVSCGSSLNIIYQGQPKSMELAQQRTLSSIVRSEPNRRRTPWPCLSPFNDHRELQHHNPRPTEPVHSSMTQIPGIEGPIDNMRESNNVERAGKTEITRTGAQVESKKSKRRFVNRTRTGCKTCRKRKKKCDETKPECNNCTRGGFTCEGYTDKVKWPKNGVAKSLPSLQAKEQMATDAPQSYGQHQVCSLAHVLNLDNTKNTSPDSYALNGHGGSRGRPITVEGQECGLPALKNWKTRWSEQFRVPSASSYLQPPLALVHEGHASHDHHHVTHPVQNRPQSCHDPRVYHHALSSMSLVLTYTPEVVVKAHLQQPRQHQQHQHPPMALPAVMSPRPLPSHCAPEPSIYKTEKQKMLDGEPFMPYNVQLVNERAQCTAAVHHFNNTRNAAVEMAQSEREQSLKRIIAAGWIQPSDAERPVGGHLGGGVHAATPFHCDYGYNIYVGDNVIIGPNCRLLDSSRISIGKNTTICACATITTLEIPTDTRTFKGSKGTKVAKEVYIGENVYVGDGCIIEAGVRIGNGAIIRPGSVVVRDIPPNCIAFGNPANCT